MRRRPSATRFSRAATGIHSGTLVAYVPRYMFFVGAVIAMMMFSHFKHQRHGRYARHGCGGPWDWGWGRVGRDERSAGERAERRERKRAHKRAEREPRTRTPEEAAEQRARRRALAEAAFAGHLTTYGAVI